MYAFCTKHVWKTLYWYQLHALKLSNIVNQSQVFKCQTAPIFVLNILLFSQGMFLGPVVWLIGTYTYRNKCISELVLVLGNGPTHQSWHFNFTLGNNFSHFLITISKFPLKWLHLRMSPASCLRDFFFSSVLWTILYTIRINVYQQYTQ